MVLYLMALVLFCVGLYSILVKKNVLKIIIGLIIMEYAVSLIFILIGYKKGGMIPLMREGLDLAFVVDPLPQSVIIILLLLNLSVMVVACSIAVRIFEKYETFDITKMRRLKG